MFDEESTSRSRAIIDRLATTYQSVSFTPHITLSETPDWTDKKIRLAIDKIANESQPLELKTTSVRCSSNPYQKLTHGIQTTDQLDTIHQKTDTYFEGDFAKKAYPHISYLYSRLNCSEVAHEIVSIQKDASQKIIANQFVLVDCKGTPADWRVLFRWKLNY